MHLQDIKSNQVYSEVHTQPNWAPRVVVLFLFSMKHFFLLILPRYFNTTLEYNVIYFDGTSNYIRKDDFDSAQVFLL